MMKNWSRQKTGRNRSQKCWNGGEDKNGTKKFGQGSENNFGEENLGRDGPSGYPTSQVTDTLLYRYHLYNPLSVDEK